MADMLKVVNIGGFGHAGAVLNAIASHDTDRCDVRLVGYAPALEGESLSLVESHSIYASSPTRYDDYRQMLADVGGDIAIVGTRLNSIAEAALAAIEAGYHVICEKPLALDRGRLRELYAAARSGHVQVLAMLSMRMLPQIVAAGRACREGRIGRPVLINTRKSYKWGVRPDWFGDRQLYGGTIPWVGIHALDMINAVTGQRFAEVAAIQRNGGHPERRDCEDTCAIIMRLEDDTLATASIDYFRPDNAPTHGDDWLRVVGTNGSIEVRAIENSCRLLDDSGTVCDLELPGPRLLYNEFFEAVRTGQPMTDDVNASFILTDASLAARDAADADQTLQIDQGWIGQAPKSHTSE